MIQAAGAEGVIIGHSERRAAGEDDARVAAKVSRALDAGLRVIFCIGESLEQREAGETEAWLEGQVTAVLEAVAGYEPESLVIAYEPIWAIGTGKTATPEMAQETCAHVRAIAGAHVSENRTRVLYGGSVKPGKRRGAALAARYRRRPRRWRLTGSQLADRDRPRRLRRPPYSLSSSLTTTAGASRLSSAAGTTKLAMPGYGFGGGVFIQHPLRSLHRKNDVVLRGGLLVDERHAHLSRTWVSEKPPAGFASPRRRSRGCRG